MSARRPPLSSSLPEPPQAKALRPPAGPVPARLAEPLLGLAPRARLLALVGGGLALVAVPVWLLAGGRPGALVAVPGAALLLSAAAGTWLARRRRRRQATLGAQLAQTFAQGPDAVLVTDAEGRLEAANHAAASGPEPALSPRRRLEGWCVEPAETVAALLAEVRRSGAATQEFWRKDNGLRVAVFAVEQHPPMLVWSFAALRQGSDRPLEALGLPLVSWDGARIEPNAAARLLFEGAQAALASLVAETLAARPLPGRGGGPWVHGAALPSGRAVWVLGVPARDGLVDMLLLAPLPSVLPGADAEGRETAAPQIHDIEDIPVALIQLDPDGRISGSNRLARGLLGVVRGETRFFWEVVEGLGRPVADWLDDARAGRALGRPEVLRATLTGQEKYVQITLRQLGGGWICPEGTLLAVLADATEQKSLEARFVQSQKMQAIGQLAGGIAHDFNNLLTAISGHCDLLLLNRDRFDPDYGDLLQIHQNANRAAALVRQLLAFSRKQTMKPEILMVESLLEELTYLLTRLVGERVTLTLGHDAAVGAIRADRRQLEQVLMNLVVNARDAMPMGGAIRIETAACHLETELEHGRARVPPGDYAMIRVVDQGVGIPAELIDKIFEPFFTTKKMGEGTGLGLSTAYGIVKQMGGYIFCDSVEGAGTTFTLFFAALPRPQVRVDYAQRIGPPAAALQFRVPPQDEAEPSPRARPDEAAQRDDAPAPVRIAPLRRADPAQDAEPGAAGAGGAPPRGPGGGGTILLVEDEAPVRAFAARALRLQGFQVFEAQDGEQALDFLADTGLQIDLFVTDVIMPGIDGPGWVTRALQSRPGTPVVFVSGYTEETLNAALMRIPRATFLGKPFSLGDLSETIARQIVS